MKTIEGLRFCHAEQGSGGCSFVMVVFCSHKQSAFFAQRLDEEDISYDPLFWVKPKLDHQPCKCFRSKFIFFQQKNFSLVSWDTNHFSAGLRIYNRVESMLAIYITTGIEKRREEFFNFSPEEYRGNVLEYAGLRPQEMTKDLTTKNIINPTQKPITLLSYLIQKFSHIGNWVLDLCSGTGLYPRIQQTFFF